MSVVAYTCSCMFSFLLIFLDEFANTVTKMVVDLLERICVIDSIFSGNDQHKVHSCATQSVALKLLT